MKPHVLISGGTGLIGSHLTQLLLHKGYQVSFLSRQYRSLSGIEIIRWDPDNNWIEDINIKGPLAIVNLAGENLSTKLWSDEQKKVILNSRVNSLKMIQKIVKEKKDQVVRVVSASAIGYYGTFNSEEIFSEEAEPGTDFLANVCINWEDAVKQIELEGVSTARVRVGVVLSDQGGAFKAIRDSMRTGFALPLGSGKQWIPWVHIKDITQIFEFLLEHTDLTGAFNGVAPAENNNLDLTRAIARARKKILFPIGIPAFLLKMVLGEMAVISLYGSRVSSDKIQSAGYNFQYTELQEAVNSLSK